MAAKKNQSLPTRKEAIGKRPWPNLPQKVLNLLARKPNLLQQMSYPGTTKSWTMATRRCNSIYHSWYYFSRMSPPRFWLRPTPHFVGYSQGSLLTRGPNPSDFHIYEVSTRSYGKLPPLDISIPFKLAAQTSLITNPNSMVVVTGISSPAIVVYNSCQDGPAWIKQESNPCNSLVLKGKFYALSLQGTLVVMEEINSRFVITAVSTSRAVPSVSARYFKEHLLESNGEILLVFLIYRKTAGVVDRVEVFWLHIPKLSWIKLESLQERALFLENECCTWVDSSQVGCRGNCVYFTQSAANDWCTYDMGSGYISPGFMATSPPWNESVLEE
ncbi:hypothetical protein Pfo_016836 [Paulownia fortunei]|nr:hypothetical protein Pfo_016836 [Paulownia fortunei]